MKRLKNNPQPTATAREVEFRFFFLKKHNKFHFILKIKNTF